MMTRVFLMYIDIILLGWMMKERENFSRGGGKKRRKERERERK